MYHDEGPSAPVYKRRAIILNSIYNHSADNTINCWSNLSFDLISHLLNNNFDSIQTFHCSLGCQAITLFRKTIPLNLANSDNINDLKYLIERVLRSFVNGRNEQCVSCFRNSRISNGQLSDTFLCFSSIFTCPLDRVPENIETNDYTYDLVGVVEFTSNHYKAFLRLSNGEWELRDDMRDGNAVQIISKSSLSTLGVNVSLLLYVR